MAQLFHLLLTADGSLAFQIRNSYNSVSSHPAITGMASARRWSTPRLTGKRREPPMKANTKSWVALGFALLILPAALNAQEFRGTLSGLVTDPSGGVPQRRSPNNEKIAEILNAPPRPHARAHVSLPDPFLRLPPGGLHPSVPSLPPARRKWLFERPCLDRKGPHQI